MTDYQNDEESMVELDNLPGADIVGFGFDLTGRYDANSVTSSIFLQSQQPGTTVTFGGATYNLPFNLAYVPESRTKARSYVTQSQEDFTRTFSENASVDFSYGAFSGEFDFAYSNTFQSSASYYYCWYDGSAIYYGISLEDQSLESVSPAFASDVQALPSIYNDANSQDFYDFFQKWGTHYIAGVTLGASFRYYLAVERSFSSDQTQISASVELEYKAVFADTSAESQTDWSELTENWASSRTVTIMGEGGDGSIMGVGIPGYDSNVADVFQSWLASTQANPAAVDFALRKIELICGDKQQAVSAALTDYLNGVVFVSADIEQEAGGSPVSSFQISAFAQTIFPPSDPPMPQPQRSPWISATLPVGGFQLVAFDSDSFDTLVNSVYYMPLLADGYEQGVEALYERMAADIATLAGQSYVAALAGFGIESNGSFPPQPIVDWLTDCGAKLETWRGLFDSTNLMELINYLFIGGSSGVTSPVERCETVSWYTGAGLHTTAQLSIFS